MARASATQRLVEMMERRTYIAGMRYVLCTRGIVCAQVQASESSNCENNIYETVQIAFSGEMMLIADKFIFTGTADSEYVFVSKFDVDKMILSQDSSRSLIREKLPDSIKRIYWRLRRMDEPIAITTADFGAILNVSRSAITRVFTFGRIVDFDLRREIRKDASR